MGAREDHLVRTHGDNALCSSAALIISEYRAKFTGNFAMKRRRGAKGSNPLCSTIQSFGLRTSKRIARKARVFARFAIERGPGERSRRPDSAESSKTYPSAIQPRSADYCLRFACWPGHQDGSNDLAPSFIKRRDRRCRKCFSERYGSATPARKAKVKKK